MKFMTPSKAAEYLAGYGLSAGQVKRSAQQGRFPCVRVGNRIMVDVEAADRILADEARESALIGTEQLSEAIGLTPSAIRRGVIEGWLPKRACSGRALRFDMDEVQAALAAKMAKDAGDSR